MFHSPGNIESVRLLLERGARTDIKTRSGFYPYEYAQQRGYGEILHLLQEFEKNNEWLHIACCSVACRTVFLCLYSCCTWFALTCFTLTAENGSFQTHINPSGCHAPKHHNVPCNCAFEFYFCFQPLCLNFNASTLFEVIILNRNEVADSLVHQKLR